MNDTGSNGSHHRDHSRQWRDFHYVYPVVSRRSRGLSVGVNLNPQKHCNFGCLYCQVDRSIPGRPLELDLNLLRSELRAVLEQAVSGEIWQDAKFQAVPADRKRINDIAFSGDGEPTCVPQLPEAVEAAAEVKRQLGLDDVKLILITNASRLAAEPFRRARPILDDNNGEIWAKLDAGTEETFQRVNRPAGGLTLEDIVQNILGLAVARPVVIQTLLLALDGQPPSQAELDAYARHVRGIVAAGGQVQFIQLHTVARTPADPSAQPLGREQLDEAGRYLAAAVQPVPVEVFHS